MLSVLQSNERQTTSFNEPHSLAIRIWHWSFFLVLAASLVTVLFGSTVFRTRDNIGTVQRPLQEKGTMVSNDQARAVAHEFSDKLWDLHKWIGFILCALLLSRLLIEIAQPGEEKLRNKIKRAAVFSTGIHLEQIGRRHYIRVKRGYLLFYLLILIMALTGLGLAFEDVSWLKSWQKSFVQIHSFVQYLIYSFILLHLVGVIRADLGKHRGIVSGMIHGQTNP
jgi:Ni/Fe-hydrogenase 1 B-type cytochrome subunit